MASMMTQWGASQFAGLPFGLVDVPASYWIALANTEPGPLSDGTMLAQLEPTVTSASTLYERQEILADTDHWGVTDSGVVGNLTVIDFGIPDTFWGYTPYFVICDSETDGNVYGYGEFANPQTLSDTYLVRLPIGAVTLKGVNIQPSIVS